MFVTEAHVNIVSLFEHLMNKCSLNFDNKIIMKLLFYYYHTFIYKEKFIHL